MAKEKTVEQLGIFPVNPAINHLLVTKMGLKGGLLDLDVTGTTQATSLDQLTPAVLARAFIAHSVRLLGGHAFDIDGIVSEEVGAYWAEINVAEIAEIGEIAAREAA